jgi:hypothetical protein
MSRNTIIVLIYQRYRLLDLHFYLSFSFTYSHMWMILRIYRIYSELLLETNFNIFSLEKTKLQSKENIFHGPASCLKSSIFWRHIASVHSSFFLRRFTERVDLVAILQTFIREVLGSNLKRGTGCSNQVFMFFCLLSRMPVYYLTRPFPSKYFSIHLSPYIFRDAESIIKITC